MPVPIEEYTIKIIWENNPDTPITASTLSKDFDYLATYQDFKFPVVSPHREGTILMPDDIDPKRLILKKGSMFQIINEAEDPPGIPIIPINSQYRVFDIGLEDLYLTVNDKDSDPSNPPIHWGANNEWYIYICDKDDSVVYEKGMPDQYGGGAQILVSRYRNFPRGQVPGRAYSTHINHGKSPLYTEKDTRLIGGFKSDIVGNIISSSVWDIVGKHHTIKAKHYKVLDEYGLGPDSKYIYRQIDISDLNTSIISTFNHDVTIIGNLNQNSGNTTLNGSVEINGSFDVDGSPMLLDGDILIGSRINSPISHVGDFLNNSSDFEINTNQLDIEAITSIITQAPQWTNIGNLESTGHTTLHGNLTLDMGSITTTTTDVNMTSTNFITTGEWNHYGDFYIHSTVNIGSSSEPADITIYSDFDHFGPVDLNGSFTQVGGSVTMGTVSVPSTMILRGPITQNTGTTTINGNLVVNNSSISLTTSALNSIGPWIHNGSMQVIGALVQSGGSFSLSGDVFVDKYIQVGRTPGQHSSISVKSQAADGSSIRSESDSGGYSYVYVGQDSLGQGGGIFFRGSTGVAQFLQTSTLKKVVFYRTQAGTTQHHDVFSYPDDSNDVTFRGSITTQSNLSVSGTSTLSGAISLNENTTVAATKNILFATGGRNFSGSTNVAGSGGTGVVQSGYFSADRVYNAVWNDLAEYFLSEEIEVPGRVYSLIDSKVGISKNRCCRNVIGICSDTSAYVMKSEYKERGAVLIALAGTVRAVVKEKVRTGDLLVSDKFGFLTKARWWERLFKHHFIVAKAIEESKDNTEKRILVLVK